MKYKTVNNGICRDFFRAMSRRKFRQCALILHHTVPLLEQSVIDECCCRMCKYYFGLSDDVRIEVYDREFKANLFEASVFQTFIYYGFSMLQKES